MQKILKIIPSLIFSWILLTRPQAFAYDKILNGGNGVLCEAGEKSALKVLDLYEAEQFAQETFSLAPGESWENAMVRLLGEWRKIAPWRAELYSRWLASFSKEAAFVGDVRFDPVLDTGPVLLSEGCSLVGIAYQRRERDLLPSIPRYLILKKNWDSLDEKNKLYLVLHEFVYRELISSPIQTSEPVRAIARILTSAPRTEEYVNAWWQARGPFVEYGGLVLKPKADNPDHEYLERAFHVFKVIGFTASSAEYRGMHVKKPILQVGDSLCDLNRYIANPEDMSCRIEISLEFDTGNIEAINVGFGALFSFDELALRLTLPLSLHFKGEAGSRATLFSVWDRFKTESIFQVNVNVRGSQVDAYATLKDDRVISARLPLHTGTASLEVETFDIRKIRRMKWIPE